METSQVKNNPNPPVFAAGLDGVYACNTTLSDVDGINGKLIFNGFSAVELAATKTVEEVWFVLRNGRLPDEQELIEFRNHIETLSRLSKLEVGLVKKLSFNDPMMTFQSCISAISNYRGQKSWLNRDAAQVTEELMTLVALTPEVMEIMRHHRKPLVKRGNKGYAERYLWGVLGKRPSESQLRALETYMILTMDHGSNASTFNGRVAISTGPSVGAALAAAIGTLSGPLHGGAPGPVLDMFDSIGDVANVDAWVAAKMAAHHTFMGFGHRIYRTDDPRSLCLRTVAEKQSGPRIELAKATEQAILSALAAKQQAKALAENKPVRTLRVNVEFWTAVVLEHVGIPRDMFSCSFCTGRMIGWAEHLREQMVGNKIYRPLSYYTGKRPE